MPLRNGSVIVVDDDAAVRNALKFALELEGLNVSAYDSGRQLLDEPELPAKGCLVVDYYMPLMTGIQLVEVLRSRQVQLPVILITGKVTEDMRRKAMQAGIEEVLEKPLQDSSLMDSIRKALGCAI
jgi:two-component system response regulator FixJ